MRRKGLDEDGKMKCGQLRRHDGTVKYNWRKKKCGSIDRVEKNV